MAPMGQNFKILKTVVTPVVCNFWF